MYICSCSLAYEVMRTDLVCVPQTIEYQVLARLLLDPSKRLSSYPLVDNAVANYLVGAVYVQRPSLFVS